MILKKSTSLKDRIIALSFFFIKINRLIFSIILFFLSVFSSQSAWGTVIILKDGDIISGIILKEYKNYFHFQSPYGNLKMNKKEIRSIIWDEYSIKKTIFTYKNKKYTGRLIYNTDFERVYLLENGTIIRLKKPKKKSSNYNNHFTLFSIGKNYYPFPKINLRDHPDSVFNSYIPELYTEKEYTFNMYNFSIIHLYKLKPYISFGFFLEYLKYSEFVEKEHEQKILQVEYENNLFALGLKSYISFAVFSSSRNQKDFILNNFGIGIFTTFTQINSRVTIVNSNFTFRDMLGERVEGKKIAPSLGFYFFSFINFHRRLTLLIEPGLRLDFYKEIYQLDEQTEEAWGKSYNRQIFIPVFKEKFKFPVSYYLNIGLGYRW